MNFFYFLDKYFDNLNETKFKVKWKIYFQDHFGRAVSMLFFFWILVIVGTGILFIKIIGVFFGIILMLFFSGYFAYILVFQFLRFLAKHNSRFIQSGIIPEANSVNYDGVVETIKKDK